MAKHTRRSRTKQAEPRLPKETSPGATAKAFDRDLESGDGGPGSGAGSRHAAGDPGTEGEEYGRVDSTTSLAEPPIENEDPLEKGPPYAGPAGGAVGGTPAQLRSAEGTPEQNAELEHAAAESAPTSPAPRQSTRHEGMLRLTGAAAIEYADKQGLPLNKHPDSITGPRVGLNVAEAQAIADDDPDLIWIDVDKNEYYSGPPSSYEPGR